MTQPPPPPPEEEPEQVVQPPEMQPPPEEEDESALIPALLLIFGAYLLFRAANGPLPRDRNTVIKTLGIPGAVSGVLLRIAQRALARQREDAGRAGDELWHWAGDGVQDGMRDGIDIIADAILWLDDHSNGLVPPTKDELVFGSSILPDGSLVPTATNPPDLLAAFIAKAVANRAQLTVAALAGWRTKIWKSQLDSRVRETHRGLHNQRRPLAEAFVSPSGAHLMMPGDLTAPIAEWARCRCYMRTVR